MGSDHGHHHDGQDHTDDNAGDNHHGHNHSGIGHSHAPANFGRRFAIGTALNIGFVIVQVVFGLFAHSVALLADASHNLGDALGLVLAWWAHYAATKPPTARHTYGLRRGSILSALANAILLLIAAGAISWEAIRRFFEPVEVNGSIVIYVAAIGIVINASVALLFLSGRNHDLNIRGAFLHMTSDALVSAAVVVAGIAMVFTGWKWLDPAVSLLINAIIVWGTWSLLIESLNLAMDKVPPTIDISAVGRYLDTLPDIVATHDLHVWPISTTETALTVHLVNPNAVVNDEQLSRIRKVLRDRFNIGHATIQLERGDPAIPCAQEPADAV
jgi:cobalt-zinc-cadmium efflux system protein